MYFVKLLELGGNLAEQTYLLPVEVVIVRVSVLSSSLHCLSFCVAIQKLKQVPARFLNIQPIILH